MSNEKVDQLVARIQADLAKINERLDELRARLAATPTVGQKARRLLDNFKEHWEGKYPGQKMVVNGARDMAVLKRILGQLPADEVATRIARYFQTCDPFVLGTKHSVGLFAFRINELGVGTPGEPFILGCKHDPPCGTEADHTRRQLDEERQL